jgi:hypothetical protein
MCEFGDGGSLRNEVCGVGLGVEAKAGDETHSKNVSGWNQIEVEWDRT